MKLRKTGHPHPLLTLIGCISLSAVHSAQAEELYAPWRQGTVVPTWVERPDLKQIQPIYVEKIDDWAVYEGDMLLGPSSALVEPPSEPAAERPSIDPSLKNGHGVSFSAQLWPNNTLRYTLDSGFSPTEVQRINDAIQHWKDNTQLGFELLSPGSLSGNYVTFTAVSSGCAAHVGMINQGSQLINVSSQCSVGNIIHEIGHAFGLFHEHTRPDRDSYVQINYDNIPSQVVHNFNKTSSGSCGFLDYDYGSIMHYGSRFFANDPNRNTIDAPFPIGQRNGLSPGDIAAVHRLYGITANEAPRISSAQQFSTAQSQGNGSLIGVIQARDPECDNVTLQIASGNEQGAFSLNSNTGELRLVNPNALPSSGSQMSLQLIASDGQNSSNPVSVLIDISPTTSAASTGENSAQSQVDNLLENANIGALTPRSLWLMALLSLLYKGFRFSVKRAQAPIKVPTSSQIHTSSNR